MPVASTMIEFRLATVRHAVRAGQVRYGAHHHRRPDGDDLGDRSPSRGGGLEHPLERRGDEALDPERPVVGRVDHLELVAELALQGRHALVVAGPEQQARRCGTRR